MTATRLDELDKNEWHDIVKAERPDLTDEDFDDMWDRFIAFKEGKRYQ